MAAGLGRLLEGGGGGWSGVGLVCEWEFRLELLALV
eukprot:CAMPEP_0171340732 /NCGR_PEP_ID=MMETSP0878-20121228/8766_1 /TAXON_ID=67004 /ORGANISM="Thalassiosira weissflogii, Strain CCMP1336" /LENGTH=35 /DNA_ID= /DNA_START= /DNA_END= /DNA_ORIENTATION=